MPTAISYLFSSVVGNVVAIVVLFLLVLGGMIGLIVKHQLPQALMGLLRTIASIFYSPVVYLIKAVKLFVEYGLKGDIPDAAPRQYLLGKLYLHFQMLLILTTAFLFSIGLVVGWNAFIPPKEYRVAVSQMNKELDAAKDELNQLESTALKLDAEWASKGRQMFAEHRAVLQKKIDEGNAAMSAASAKYSALDRNAQQAFTSIQNSLRGYDNYTNEYTVQSVQNQMVNYNEYGSYPAAGKAIIRNYIDGWAQAVLAKIELGNISEAAFRDKIQNGYSEMKRGLEYKRSSVASREDSRNEMRKNARYHFGAFLLSILISLVQIVICIWFFGLAIEILFLGVNMANDLHDIKQHTVEKMNPGA